MPTVKDFFGVREQAKRNIKRIKEGKDYWQAPEVPIPEPDNPDPRLSDPFLKGGAKGANLQHIQEAAEAIITDKPLPTPTPKYDGKVEKVMHEFKAGALRSGSAGGPKVTNPKQAVAIGLSEARKAGEKVARKK